MGLFRSSDDSEEISEEDLGCTAHHWEGGDIVGSEVRFSRGHSFGTPDPDYKIKAKRRYRCQHSGCSETKEEWVATRTFEKDVWQALWKTLTEGDDGSS